MPDEIVPPAGDPPPAAPPAAPAAPVVPPLAPDGVTMTRRELDAHVEKAVARAVEAVQSKTMADKKTETDNAAAEEIAKLRAEVAATVEAVKADAAKQAAEMQTKLDEANQRAEESARKAEDEKKARRRAKEKVVEANLRKSAAKAGIEDEDYALVLYAREASAKVSKKDAQGNPAPEAPPDPDEFFAALGKSKPGLLRVAPQPPKASTAPADGQPAPAPTPPGKQSTGEANQPKSVDDMDHREFSGSTLSKYGFNPSVPY